MKVDRFMRIMLVLIALLLALNCAKELSPSAISQRVGVQYDVVWTHEDYTGRELTQKLNERARNGWRVKAMSVLPANTVVILEK